MYDCDKGFALTEGPPGATCIDGQWSPKQLPRYCQTPLPLMPFLHLFETNQKLRIQFQMRAWTSSKIEVAEVNQKCNI